MVCTVKEAAKGIPYRLPGCGCSAVQVTVQYNIFVLHNPSPLKSRMASPVSTLVYLFCLYGGDISRRVSVMRL